MLDWNRHVQLAMEHHIPSAGQVSKSDAEISVTTVGGLVHQVRDKLVNGNGVDDAIVIR